MSKKVSSSSSVVQWSELARALPSDELQLNVPVRAFVREAEAVAMFCEQNWETTFDPKTKAIAKRGLDSAGKGFSKTVAKEIRELVPIVIAANFEYDVTQDPKSSTASLVARGRTIVDEITASLEWLFDDGVEDKNDSDLAAIESAHAADPTTADAVALALEDFILLATPHVKELDGLGGFDPAVLAEGKKIAEDLRAAPVILGFAPSPASHAALSMRNRYLRLLQERVEHVRKAARFVYRDDPSAAAGAVSTYAKRRNAIAKRLLARKAKVDAVSPTPTNGGAQPTEVAPH